MYIKVWHSMALAAFTTSGRSIRHWQCSISSRTIAAPFWQSNESLLAPQLDHLNALNRSSFAFGTRRRPEQLCDGFPIQSSASA